MRVDQLEQVLRELGKLGIDFELYPRGHEREALKQAFDIRVRAVDTFHTKTTGDFRKLAGKLTTHLPNMIQLLVIVAKKSWIHILSR